MATFNESEAAAGNDSIFIFMQQNMSTFEYSSDGWHDIEVQAQFEAGVPERNFPNRTMHSCRVFNDFLYINKTQ